MDHCFDFFMAYNFTRWKSNFPDEPEHIKMTAFLGSFHGSLKAHDKYELASLMHPFYHEFLVSP